jgi:DNA primase
MIPDEVVEQVRSAADIVGIISEYVPLKRSGGSWRGPCPFHQGKGPNFSVSPSHGSYHCFVCHESGDVFTFVRKRLGLDWPSAIKLIGEKVGIEVVDRPKRAQAPDPNAPNHEALAATAEWFAVQLREETGGREARTYLAGRGLDESAWGRFGIGFAPRDPQAMRRYLHALGHDDARQLEAGLLVQREGEREPRGRFRGRIMFTIQDELGRHVGFGGRALGDDTPKYLNSPESPVFQKRRTLYGLHTAKQAMRRAERGIVVEGYLDAIRLALAGIEEVVAPLGTALTEEQAQLLRRYTGEVFLLYDSDEAGQKATFRSGLELLQVKAAVRVASLPDGEDPDTFVRAQGRAALETQLSTAIDLFDRQVQLLERRGWFTDLRQRRRAIDKLLPTIRAAADPLMRDLYLARLADVTHLDKATLATEAEQFEEPRRSVAMGAVPAGEAIPDAGPWPPPDLPPGDAYASGTGSPVAPAGGEPRPPWKGRRGRSQGPTWAATAIPPRPRQDEPVERLLLRAMCRDRSVAELVAERHPPVTFRHAAYRELFSALLRVPWEAGLDQIADGVSDEAVAVLREVTESEPVTLEATDLQHCLDRLEARSLEARIAAIREALGAAPRDEQDQLMRERLALEAELRRVQPVRPVHPRRRGGSSA